jgi:hypothetical protein
VAAVEAEADSVAAAWVEAVAAYEQAILVEAADSRTSVEAVGLRVLRSQSQAAADSRTSVEAVDLRVLRSQSRAAADSLTSAGLEGRTLAGLAGPAPVCPANLATGQAGAEAAETGAEAAETGAETGETTGGIIGRDMAGVPRPWEPA